ncbi:hypothetical protein FA95DRAFT_1568145, partial [Auriscalpium vulgare]
MEQLFVIIDDPNVAVEILDRRGSTYADRPEMPMAALCGFDRAMSGTRYGPRLREYRKLIGRVIGTKGSMVKFYPAEEYQSTMFLKRVMNKPAKLDEVGVRTAGAMVLQITYGFRIKEEGSDPLVDLADRTLLQFSKVMPGMFLVDVLPWL